MGTFSQISEARLLSRPFPVEWAGWRSDTARLQQSGWQIAVDQDIAHMRHRILLKHSMLNLYAISAYSGIADWPRVVDPTYRDSDLPVFYIQGVSARIEVMRMAGPMTFREIDAQPTITTAAIQSIEDMRIFNVPLTRAEEIIVDAADLTVLEHLNEIKKLQSVEQRAIRDRSRRPTDLFGGSIAPQVKVHANLVSLVDTA